jgi:hypothetical protein
MLKVAKASQGTRGKKPSAPAVKSRKQHPHIPDRLRRRGTWSRKAYARYIDPLAAAAAGERRRAVSTTTMHCIFVAVLRRLSGARTAHPWTRSPQHLRRGTAPPRRSGAGAAGCQSNRTPCGRRRSDRGERADKQVEGLSICEGDAGRDKPPEAGTTSAAFPIPQPRGEVVLIAFRSCCGVLLRHPTVATRAVSTSADARRRCGPR